MIRPIDREWQQDRRGWFTKRRAGLVRAHAIHARAFYLYLDLKRSGRTELAAIAFRVYKEATRRMQQQKRHHENGVRYL